MAYLVIHNLWKQYRHQTVLEKIDLTVERGAFCTIVGASGCGKSTFLRLLLGQERPSRGTILLEGGPLSPEPGPERGVVFQRYSVFPHLTVLGNAMIGLEFQGAPRTGRLWGRQRRQARERAEALLATVGLSEALHKYPTALSGGMQQRLALAQALLVEPKILLLDEPFGALDPGIRADMQQLLKRLWQQWSMTIFMVTHDLSEAFALGTRLLVFDKVRQDPHAPEAYGATITYDLPLNRGDENAPQETFYVQKAQPLCPAR